MQVKKSVYDKHVKYEEGHQSNTRRRFHGTSCSSDCNYFFDLKVSNSYILRVNQLRTDRTGFATNTKASPSPRGEFSAHVLKVVLFNTGPFRGWTRGGARHSSQRIPALCTHM